MAGERISDDRATPPPPLPLVTSRKPEGMRVFKESEHLGRVSEDERIVLRLQGVFSC